MDERIPAPVRPILERYRQLLEARLPGLVQALYLHGSVALDAFNERLSDVTSKTGAGQYALSCLPARWHRLIQEAIQIREGGRPSLYRSRLGRAWEALSFLKVVIAACNGAGG